MKKAKARRIKKVQTLLADLFVEIVGKEGEKLAYLLSEKPVSELKIAEKLRLHINQARNLLYKLNEAGVASFTRKKEKKKGWYVYSWSLNPALALSKFIDLRKKQLSSLRGELASKTEKRFYVCSDCGVEFTEENALLRNFTCPECGKLLELESPVEKLAELKREIERKESEITAIKELLPALAKPVPVKPKPRPKPKAKPKKLVPKRKVKVKKPVKRKK